jgi:uridine kinase
VGGSGAGKGWLIGKLRDLLGERAGHLQLDDFYRDRSHLPPRRRARLNFDVPHAIDWEAAAAVLRACRAGEAVRLPRYDFATHSRRPEGETWLPRPVVFVDGLWLLRSRALRELFDYSVFLDTPARLRHRRRLARDVAERGYTAAAVAYQWETHVAPMHDRYVEPQKRHARLVLAQPFRAAELDALAAGLGRLLLAAGALEAWQQEKFRADLTAQLSHDEPRH